MCCKCRCMISASSASRQVKCLRSVAVAIFMAVARPRNVMAWRPMAGDQGLRHFDDAGLAFDFTRGEVAQGLDRFPRAWARRMRWGISMRAHVSITNRSAAIFLR